MRLALEPLVIRKQLGLSQSQMAKVLGIHVQTWGKWERKEQHPPAAVGRFMLLLLQMHRHGRVTWEQWLKLSEVVPHPPRRAREPGVSRRIEGGRAGRR